MLSRNDNPKQKIKRETCTINQHRAAPNKSDDDRVYVEILRYSAANSSYYLVRIRKKESFFHIYS